MDRLGSKTWYAREQKCRPRLNWLSPAPSRQPGTVPSPRLLPPGGHRHGPVLCDRCRSRSSGGPLWNSFATEDGLTLCGPSPGPSRPAGAVPAPRLLPLRVGLVAGLCDVTGAGHEPRADQFRRGLGGTPSVHCRHKVRSCTALRLGLRGRQKRSRSDLSHRMGAVVGLPAAMDRTLPWGSFWKRFWTRLRLGSETKLARTNKTI